jgi:hypothetical protein
VTVLYGFNLEFEASKITEVLPGSVSLKLGKVSRFKCPEYDVLKVDVDSGDLEKLNAKLAQVFGGEITKSKHDYHPHLTIAYIKKGTCNELDGREDFKGRQPHIGQLLYSLPEKQGRRVFDLGASAKAIQAADPVAVPSPDFSAHEAARAKAETHYKRAVAKLVAQAEASALAARLQDEDERKKRRAHDEEAAALLFLLAGAAAYRASYKSLAASPQGALGLQSAPLPQLGAENTPTGLQTPANEPLEPEPDAEVDRQAEEFAQERAELLKDVPNKVRDALDAELAKPDAAAESLRELSERLGKVAQKIEDGYGKMVMNTETHTAYGHAALRVLQWRGYETKVWQAVGDERTCPTCMGCEDLGPMPMGAEFVPGVVAPPAHNSCRCWLVGGRLKAEPVSASEPVMAVHVKTYTRVDPRTGKQETVAEHEDKRAKQMTPEQVGHVRVDKYGSGAGTAEVKLKPSKARTFNGDAVEVTRPLTKQEAGALGEKIVIAYLHKQGLTDARPLNLKQQNYAVDLVQDHGAIEVKTGIVSNGRSAQQWRATIGQPGKEETAKLAKMSPEKKKAWNAAKAKAILERKQRAVEELSKTLGRKVKAWTMTTIINPDTRMVDVFKFEGFHLRIPWNSEQTQKAYVGSYQY